LKKKWKKSPIFLAFFKISNYYNEFDRLTHQKVMPWVTSSVFRSDLKNSFSFHS